MFSFQIINHLPSSTITYAEAKSLSTNPLTRKFFEKYPQWIRTDPNIFYSFTLQSASFFFVSFKIKENFIFEQRCFTNDFSVIIGNDYRLIGNISLIVIKE